MNLTPRPRELRKNATRAEQHLWYEYLRLCQPKIRRQHVLADFILDFYCINAANANTCAMAMDKNIWCWGENSDGQLGNDSTQKSFRPVQVETP